MLVFNAFYQKDLIKRRKSINIRVFSTNIPLFTK